MKTYVIFTRLTDEGRKTVKKYPDRIKQVNKAVEGWGVTILAQYALLGQYDFLNIIEAEDEHVVLKAAMELEARGTVETMTVPAIPIDDFIKDFKPKKK
jgi:uncharacterized protein with GYD domain